MSLWHVLEGYGNEAIYRRRIRMDLTSFHMTRRTSEEAIDRSSNCFSHYDDDGLWRNYVRCI